MLWCKYPYACNTDASRLAAISVCRRMLSFGWTTISSARKTNFPHPSLHIALSQFMLCARTCSSFICSHMHSFSHAVMTTLDLALQQGAYSPSPNTYDGSLGNPLRRLSKVPGEGEGEGGRLRVRSWVGGEVMCAFKIQPPVLVARVITANNRIANCITHHTCIATM